LQRAQSKDNLAAERRADKRFGRRLRKLGRRHERERLADGLGGVDSLVWQFDNPALLKHFYGDAVLRGASGPVYVKKVADAIGWGLFADRRFRPGDFIAVYTGVETTYAPEDHYAAGIPTLGRRRVISGREQGAYGRWINHAPGDKANATWIYVTVGGELYLALAARTWVAPGEEFRVD